MARYLTEVQLKTNLRLDKSVEQWLSHHDEEDYTIINWLRIDKEDYESYIVTYFECFDEGNKDFIDIYEFSSLHPDEQGITNTFESVDEVLAFAMVTYNASMDKFVSAGMIQEEYRDYLNLR